MVHLILNHLTMEYFKTMEKYILLDKMYFLVNLWSCHTRVLYWFNTVKYTPSRASPKLTFPVLGQLYRVYILQF